MTEETKRHFDMDKVRAVWAEYERSHDLTGKERLAVGIDPDTGEVFLGESAIEIGKHLKREGRFRPLFYRWVGDPYYIHKGGRR
jgi:hypothetical protein